jgi:bla regulator protein BlaR1
MNTLDLLFSWFLTATVRGAILAIAVLALQTALRRWIPARWLYALWLPVVIVLVTPYLPHSRWSLQNLFVSPAQHQVLPAAPETNSDFQVGSAPAAAPLASPALPSFDWRRPVQLAWLAGVVGTLFFMFIAYGRTLRRIREGAITTDANVQAMLTEATRACRLRRSPRFLLSTAVQSPAVAGLFHPTLLLPKSFPGNFTPSEAHLILLHELTHLKRHDLLLNWLLCVIQSVHWCNPIFWFVFARIRADREAACDAQVLALSRGDSRADYGHALLKLESAPGIVCLNLGFMGIFERTGGILRRIRAIAAFREAHPAWSGLSVVLIGVLLLSGATGAEESVASDPVAAVRASTQPGAKAKEIQEKMKSIVIPKISFRDLPTRNAIEYLEQLSTELDPAKTGIPISLRGFPAHGETKLQTPMTLDLTNIPFGEALTYVVTLAEMKYRILDSGIEITPRITADSLNQEVIAKMKSIVIPKVEFHSASAREAFSFLQKISIKLDPAKTGVSFTYRGFPAQTAPSGPGAPPDPLNVPITVSLNNIPVLEATQSVASLAGFKFCIANSEVVIYPMDGDWESLGLAEENSSIRSADGSASIDANKVQKIRNKLNTLVIPKLVLRDATLRESLDTLRKFSTDLDPEKQGVNLVLKLEDPGPASPASPAESSKIPGLPPEAQLHITVSLSNIPLGEALRYVTNLTGLKFKVDESGVTIVPMAAQLSRKWTLTPSILNAIGYKPGMNIQDLLISHGVNFPPHASASISSDLSSLVMKNTDDNAELTDAILADSAARSKRPQGSNDNAAETKR